MTDSKAPEAKIGTAPQTVVWDGKGMVERFKKTARAQFEQYNREGGYRGFIHSTAADLIQFVHQSSATVGHLNISVSDSTYTVQETLADTLGKEPSRVAQDICEEIKRQISLSGSGIIIKRLGPCVSIRLTKYDPDDEMPKARSLWVQHQIHWYNSDQRTTKLPNNPVHPDSIFCMHCLKGSGQLKPRVICQCALQVWASLCAAEEGYNTLLPGMDIKLVDAAANSNPDDFNKKLTEQLGKAVVDWRNRCIAVPPAGPTGVPQNGARKKGNNKKKHKKKKPKAPGAESEADTEATDDDTVFVEST